MTDIIEKSIDELRQPCDPVTDPEEARDIIAQLERVLAIHQNGLGLSAPQIGIRRKVAILRWPFLKINIINPFDVEKTDKTFVYKAEGCLSFPGVYKNTRRSCGIEYGCHDIHLDRWEESFHINHGEILVNTGVDQGKPITNLSVRLQILTAVQHEVDHITTGALFFDYQLKPREVFKIPRNSPCPCGSGKKYKRCCINK